jgi:archaellum biogenesis ATPase FlaH
VENKMQLDKEICNLPKKINKRQSNGVILEMMMSKMTIDLNVLNSFMKNRVVSNLNRALVVTIHRSEMRKKLSYMQVTKQFIW